jgi:two-component system phosphate regulon sensor histidine kinase PhoR
VVELGNREGAYVLSVSDTGSGIPPEAQARVFERFFRVDKPGSRAGDPGTGAGLGLAIAQSIAKAHGGSLSLERSDPGGSTFVAVLPIQLSESA